MGHVYKRLVGVSLKMYFDSNQTEDYTKAIAQSSAAGHQGNDTGVFILPSLPCIHQAAAILSSPILLGAQNCHWEDRGAYTGEVSPHMLKQLGCDIVELGHAERRRAPFNETDELVAKKAQAAVRNSMMPLICIGEIERSAIASEAVGIAVKQCIPQVAAPLLAVSDHHDRTGYSENGAYMSVVFAYEPVWAIGAPEPAGADHVLAVIAALRMYINETLGIKGRIRFLYGGSAGPGTWEKLKGGCDGLFLGRFAHDVGNFVKVIEEVAAD